MDFTISVCWSSRMQGIFCSVRNRSSRKTRHLPKSSRQFPFYPQCRAFDQNLRIVHQTIERKH
jgi:hypothetical protein